MKNDDASPLAANVPIDSRFHESSSEDRIRTELAANFDETDGPWYTSTHKQRLEEWVTSDRSGATSLRQVTKSFQARWSVTTDDDLVVIENSSSPGQDKGDKAPSLPGPLWVLLRSTVRLIQLLATCTIVEHCNDDAATGQEMMLTQGELQKSSMEVLQTLSKAMCRRLLHDSSTHNTSGPDETDKSLRMTSSVQGDMANLLLRKLLDEVNPLIEGRLFLVGPLWRGFCDIASSLRKSHTFSETIIPDAISVLLSYLKDGEERIRVSLTKYIASKDEASACNLEELKHHVTLLNFFLVRLSTLGPIFLSSTHSATNDESRDISLIGECVAILARLRGLGIVANSEATNDRANHPTFLPPFVQMVQKVDKTLAKICFSDSNIYSICIYEILGLTKPSKAQSLFRSKKQNKGLRQDLLSVTSFALGKLSVMHVVLRKLLSLIVEPSQEYNSEVHDVALSICEDLVFVSLPTCHACLTALNRAEQMNEILIGLLSDTIELIVDYFLYSYNDFSSKTSDIGSSQHILIRWLAPFSEGVDLVTGSHLHPFSQHTAISVTHNYILRLATLDLDVKEDTSIANQALVHFLSLLSALLFDQKTTYGHRRNIASLMQRILCGRSCSISSSSPLGISIAQRAAKIAEEAILDQWQLCLKEAQRSFKKKRKHTRKKRKTSAPHFLGSFSTSIPADDLLVIGHVLEHLKMSPLLGSNPNEPLQDKLQIFFSDIIQDKSRNKFYSFKTFGDGGRLMGDVSFLFEILIGIVKEFSRTRDGKHMDERNMKPSLEHSFMYQTGTPLLTFQDQTMKWLANHFTDMCSDKMFPILVSNAYSCIAFANAIRFLHYSFKVEAPSFSSDHFTNMSEMLLVFMEWFSELNNDVMKYGSSEIASHRPALYLISEVIGLLGAIGPTVPTTCHIEHFSGIASCFERFMNSSRWPIVAMTTSSLEILFTALPTNHGSMLASKVPKHCLPLMRCRLNGTICPSDSSCQISPYDYSDSLLDMFEVKPSKGRKLLMTCTEPLPTGSTVLSLRNARGSPGLLVLPPGFQAHEELHRGLRTLLSSLKTNDFTHRLVNVVAKTNGTDSQIKLTKASI